MSEHHLDGLGSVCEEGRRRNLRCDGKEPQCGDCSDSIVLCVTVLSRSQRASRRKGSLESSPDLNGYGDVYGDFGCTALAHELGTVPNTPWVSATLEHGL